VPVVVIIGREVPMRPSSGVLACHAVFPVPH
jgi:hypothetical protein